MNYYLYHRAIGKILTTNGWKSHEELTKKAEKIIGIPSKKSPMAILESLKSVLSKKDVGQMVMLKEENLKKTWPKVQGNSENALAIAETNVAPLKEFFKSNYSLTYLDSPSAVPLIKEKPAKPTKKTKSPSLTPAKTPEPVINSLKNKNTNPIVKPEENPLPPKVEEILKTPASQLSIHSALTKDKQLTKVMEEQKLKSLRSSFSVEDYEFTQNIADAAENLRSAFEKVEEITTYYAELLKVIESQIEDELHFIEFSPVEVDTSILAFQRLQDLRMKRRCTKDSIAIADILVKTCGKDASHKLDQAMEKIETFDRRSYLLRAPEDFTH